VTEDRLLAIVTRHVGGCRIRGQWCLAHEALTPGPRSTACETYAAALALGQAVADYESEALTALLAAVAWHRERLADRVSGPSLAEWVAAGVVRGFVVPAEDGEPMVCATHAGLPYTEDEAALIQAEDGDPDVVCAWAVRVAP
jgi:hypothetical protein